MSKYNYFQEILIDGYDFPTTPQVDFGFMSQGIALLNRGNFTIVYSFNGIDEHGDLRSDDASAGIIFDNRLESKVWFKAEDGYGSVRVEAWGQWGR